MSDAPQHCSLFGCPECHRRAALAFDRKEARQPALLAPSFATDAPRDEGGPAGSLFGDALETDRGETRSTAESASTAAKPSRRTTVDNG